MANLKVTLELDSQGYIRNIKAADSTTKDFASDATRSFNKVDQSMDQLNQRSANLSQGFGRLKSAIAGVAIGAFIGKAMSGADAISDLSDATDLSVGKLLEFEKALIAAGGKGDDAAKAITGFYDSIQQANNGTDKTIEQFQKLGVSQEDLRKLSESDLLDKTLKGFKNLTDPVLKSTIAVDIFTKAFKTVDPNKLSGELEKLRGTLGEQERATIATAAAIERFDKFIGNLKAAVILLVEPFLKFTGSMTGGVTSSEKLAATLKQLLAVYAGIKTFLIVNTVLQNAFNAAIAAGSMKGKGALAGAVGGAAIAGAASYEYIKKLLKDIETQSDDTNESLIENRKLGLAPPTKVPGDRAQEPAKELTSQLTAIQNMADGYRRLNENNISRYQLEVDILGKNKEEVETMRGLSDINKRYGDQRAALEEKLKGAKGATVRLIKTEIANLDVLKTKETAAYLEARKKISANAENIAQTKIILDLMEQQAQAAQEIAGFQSQQGQAKVQAFEQVKAQSDALDLLGQREALEKSIMNMRGSDQENIKKLFDLEQQRKTQLEATSKIPNLEFEGVGGMKQRLEEINKIYDARRVKIEETAAATKAEQDSFAYGWMSAGEKFRNNIKTDAEYAADQFSNLTKGFEDAFVKFVQTGKLSFKDLINTMIAQAVRVQSTKLLSSLFGLFGFGSVGITGGGGGGAMANGGTVQGNTPYLIGERGPELFVPNNAGRIIPNNRLGDGGGGTQVINNAVTYSIQAVDASSFRSMLARDPEFIHNVAEQGRRQMPIRSRR